MTVDDNKLRRILVLAAKATPGAYKANGTDIECRVGNVPSVTVATAAEVSGAHVEHGAFCISEEQAQLNAAYFASLSPSVVASIIHELMEARAWRPALVRENERLRQYEETVKNRQKRWENFLYYLEADEKPLRMMEQAAEIQRLREKIAAFENDPNSLPTETWTALCDLASSNPTAPEWLREILKDRRADQT